MQKDYVKYGLHSNSQNKKQGWLKRLLIVFLVSVLLVGGWYTYSFYLKNSTHLNFKGLKAFFVKNKQIDHFLTEEDNGLDQNPPYLDMETALGSKINSEESKKAAKSKIRKHVPEHEIHFTFYSELPKQSITENNDLTASAKYLNSSNDQIPITKTKTLKSVSSDVIYSELSNRETNNLRSEKIKVSVNSFSPKKENYFLQIGAFKNAVTASDMRVTLLLAGIEVNVVKKQVKAQSIYLLQVGPFSNLQYAKEKQILLREKGFKPILINNQVS